MRGSLNRQSECSMPQSPVPPMNRSIGNGQSAMDRRRVLALMLAAALFPGCASRQPAPGAQPPGPAGAPVLTLLDTVVIPTEVRPPDGRRETWFGSLSGLARDPKSGRYLAVVDDRQPSRVAWLDITAEAGRLSVKPGEVVPVRPSAGVDERLVAGADLESIVALPNGTWVAGDEGHYSTGAPGQPPAGEWPPALLSIGRDLHVTRLQSWPDRFALGPARGGVRDNQGFEGLTRTPDGRLIAGLEQPLHADLPAPPRNGRPFGGGKGGPGRLVELMPEGGGWTPRREWVYPLDPTAVRPGERICDDGENGLTELLALDDTRLVAVERGCLLREGGVRNTVRLYLVDPTSADDVSPDGGVAVAEARPVSKTLLVDFDSLIPAWPPALKDLDNFEALAFGPPLADGRRTLLVVSDDNFRATQNTVFVWFRIEEAGRRNQQDPKTSRHRLVADAAHGEQQCRPAGIVFHVAAETHDEVVDGARVGVFAERPDVFENRLARDRLAGVSDQVGQQVALHLGEVVGVPCHLQLEGVQVDDAAVEVQGAAGRRLG
jgi:hypothetical protein